MSIETEILKKQIPNIKKLIEYGFEKKNNDLYYSKNILNNSFKVEITIKENYEVVGKIFETDFGDEYTNFRLENDRGEFAGKIRNEYENLLKEISNQCFEKQFFIFEQTNRITKMIKEKYNVSPEFLWEKFSDFGIFRKQDNEKWFAIVMNINKNKFDPNENYEVEIINLKVDNQVNELLKLKGIYPGYHSNKKYWISIILDNTFTDEEIMKYIELSFNNC